MDKQSSFKAPDSFKEPAGSAQPRTFPLSHVGLNHGFSLSPDFSSVKLLSFISFSENQLKFFENSHGDKPADVTGHCEDC